MSTQYYTASSLDGFIATEDHSLDWLLPLGDINDTGYPDFIRGVGALAMGASTYAWMLRHVVMPEGRAGAPWPYEQPCWVFTHRQLPVPDAADVRLVQGDVRPVHEAMCAAAGARHVWLVGGGELVGQFHDAGLLDELIVQVASVTLARGQPLLPRRITQVGALRLTQARVIGPGFAELRYAVQRPAAGSAP